MRHMRWLSLLLVAAALAAVLPATASATRGVTITTRDVGSFGRVLVDGRGLPLYYFTRDRGATSRCWAPSRRRRLRSRAR